MATTSVMRSAAGGKVGVLVAEGDADLAVRWHAGAGSEVRLRWSL